MADQSSNYFDKSNDNRVKFLISPLSDDYSPSISDKTRAGYFSQECASQTERSDVVNLKEVTSMAEILVKDLSILKKSLYYARHVLEADYKTKLEEKGLDLYCRVNNRILDLEKMHEERVKTIRRSFRQQLSDAVVQITNDNERITQERLDEKARLAEKRQLEEVMKKEKGKALQQQEALIMMMKMQMKEQQERAEKELEEALMARCTPSPVESTGERDHLVSQITNLESRLEEMDAVLEDVKNENKQLIREVDDLSEQLEREKEVTGRLRLDIGRANADLAEAQSEAKRQLEKQKFDLQREFDNRLRRVKEDFEATSQKQLDDYKTTQMSKLRERELTNQRLVEEAMKKQEKEVIPDSSKDAMIKKLQQIEIKLNAEIARLRRELGRANKTWEMKVTILKQSINALKDEAFLRASLQKQAARLHHASVTYASDGPVIVPRDPPSLNRRYRLLPLHDVGEEKERIIQGRYPTTHQVFVIMEVMRKDCRTICSPSFEATEPSSKIDTTIMATSASQRKDSDRTVEVDIKT